MKLLFYNLNSSTLTNPIDDTPADPAAEVKTDEVAVPVVGGTFGHAA
jgi:hypothetical protein